MGQTRSRLEPQIEKSADRFTSRATALAEVTVVLAAAHVTCRWFKHCTPLGRAESAAHLNFSPGWTMALFAFAVLFVMRRDLSAYGLVLSRWPWEFRQSLALASARTRIPVAWWWSAVWVSFAVSIVVGLINRPFNELAWLMAWQFFATAFGEEVFFRGYVQTRLNEVFPRGFAFRGIRFGAGLFFTALFFGLLHAFNTVDYFNGRFTFVWTLAVSTAATGFLFGLLREATGSIVTGIVVHFLNNMLWFTVMPPGAWSCLSKPWS